MPVLINQKSSNKVKIGYTLRLKSFASVAMVLALGVNFTISQSLADDAMLLARADQAFNDGQYKTAMELYRKIEPTLPDGQRRSLIQEKIRVGERFLQQTDSKAANPSLVPSTQPAAQRVPLAKPADGKALELTLHQLGNFEYDEATPDVLPADVKTLSGSMVRIQGQMLPLDQVGKVSRFLLVNDLMSCCFGQAPKLQNVAMVTLPKEKWVEPTTERLQIEGVLRVEVKKDDGFVVSIFEIEPSSIKYAPQ